eukprot:TRINITY_DN4222_c0_g2_i2.p1 TRINITY_DN4222_c0_g2~~TRINITY_DN4222_c0_g2_i2.p1  ORF type:complete len:149 (+),score=24.17 TRINITY_DN4222_c0_g2_i2:687-1133(+)
MTKMDEVLVNQQRMLEFFEQERTKSKLCKNKRKVTKQEEIECVSAFRQFASAYEATLVTERPSKLRRVATEFPDLLNDLLKELRPTMLEANPTNNSFSDFDISWDGMFSPVEAQSAEFSEDRYKNIAGSLLPCDLQDTLGKWLCESSL